MDAAASRLSDPEVVLDFWFGRLDEFGQADREHSQRWWQKDSGFDAELRERFGSLHAAAMRGWLGSWLDRERSRLAYIVLLDQFSRNMFRGTPQMFGSDELALEAALSGIELGMDKKLPLDERSFFYMPLLHSERLALQERSVILFQELMGELSGSVRAAQLQRVGYAEQHREVIRRFGRFPHRNAVLGRQSTPDELEFLAGPGATF
jgi:uncharacterized protein (DUF924 family)